MDFNMKLFYNAGYFFREVKKLIQSNLLSNVFSLLSMGLILFLLALVISGGWISSQIIDAIQGEAEINVYFDEEIDEKAALQMAEEIRDLEGVREARIVDENEAYQMMREILGKEARVWEFFDDNPFSAFIQVRIDLAQIGTIRQGLDRITGIEHVRDNKEILERLRNISGAGRLLGYLIIAAVGISTVVIISHIIRLGIDSNKEQINTLVLLGAPETFIAIPFLMTGMLITLCGGILAALFAVFTLKQIYLQIAGPLPFIPLPPLQDIETVLLILIPALGAVLGLAGSIFGLLSARRD